MSSVTRTTSTKAVRSPSPPPSDRQLRPLPHRSPSSAGTVITLKATQSVRPSLVARPSMSQFVTTYSTGKAGQTFAVQGSCQSCMAQMRDAYDKMHAEHVKAEAGGR